MNMYRIFAAALLASTPLVASACPDPDLWGADLRPTQQELRTGVVRSVVAGGAADLNWCLPGFGAEGYVSTAPDFTFYYSASPGAALSFETRADCDAVLLVVTGNRNYFFDDDDGPSSEARITLTRPSSGWYDVWVGTYHPEPCWAELVVHSASAVRVSAN
jgi:hypothetical protein